jgi:hypothetical protein
MLNRRRALGSALILSLAACEPDLTSTPPTAGESPQPATTAGCAGTQKPAGSSEGEVFGSIYQNGERTCQLWEVSLTPYADAQSRLHMASYKSTLMADWKWANMFEWWEPTAGFPCGSAGQTPAQFVQNGSPWAEVPHAAASPKEGHCVRPGRYFFEGPGGGFDVDYIQWSHRTAVNSGTGATEFVESAVYNPDDLSAWQDLVINIDLTTTHPGDSPVLEIQNAGSDPYLGTFSDDAAPSGTAEDWFRFSVMRSTSGWHVDTRGEALARLYFDGTDLSQATGYYSYIPENAPVLRLHRFPNPTTASKQYSVGLELKRPDELVEDIGTPTVTRTVTISRINPDLAAGTVTAPAQGTTESVLDVTIAERNLGTSAFAPVEAGWTGKLYLSTDPIFSPATDVLMHTYVETSAIAAGQTISAVRQAEVPVNTAPGTYYVIASLDANNTVIERDEGNNVAASGPVSIAEPLDACATFEGTTTWRNTDQLFSASCSSSGPNIQYRWQTDSGGPWTAYSTDPSYEFFGHGTAGTHVVTVEVKNVSTGASATAAYTFTVQSGIVTMSGPTFISVKANYSYSANVASFWWDRFVPSTQWTGGIGPQSTWTRTWSAGCYDVDLRADASSGGVLKRGRLYIQVAIGQGCLPPP